MLGSKGSRAHDVGTLPSGDVRGAGSEAPDARFMKNNVSRYII